MKRTSLIRRATFAVLLIESICALGFASTALWHEYRARLRALDVAIEGRSDALLGAVQDAEDPGDHVKVDPAEFKPPGSDVYAVYTPAGELVGASSSIPNPLVALGKEGFHDASAGRHSYRVLQRNALRIIDREETGGVGRARPVVVLYATRSDHVWHEVLEAVNFYLLMSLALLAVSAAILIYLLRRLLAPLNALAAEAAGVKADAPAFRAPASALRVKELGPLAEALSSTIARLRLAFETEHRFMSDAAHELKTAVSVVRSTIQVLSMRTRTQEEYRRGLDQVLADNSRVEELVSSMLTLGRLSETKDCARIEIDLAQQVALALNHLTSFAEARDVRIVCSLQPELKIKMPPDGIPILVSNLVTNAVQHSRQGTEVRVTVRSCDGARRRAVLEVRDSGSGIAPENLPHIFERFFREDPSRSRETGGAGLGLAICKNLVEAAGGNIELQSIQGQGTEVSASFILA